METTAAHSYRVWTNEKGQKLTARFVSLNGTGLVLARKDGRELKLHVAHFAPGDRA